MLSRILLYLIGLILTSFSITLIIIYLSYSNLGYSLPERIFIIIKNPSTYLLILGIYLSLKALFPSSHKTGK